MKPMDWTGHLQQLGYDIRQRLNDARNNGQEMAKAVANEGGDTIFAIDRHVEPVIEAAANKWASEGVGILLIAEGFGKTGEKYFGSPGATQRFRVLMDPIDGTRNIMYDKRAAWFLAAAMPDNGPTTKLSDSIASVMVELPVSKQGQADSLTAIAHSPSVATRMNLADQISRPLELAASQAVTLREGFGQVSNFFPGTKLLAAELMERIVERTLGKVEPGTAAVFEDQYISTGGQMVELIMGRDRFCCDLRPLFYQILQKQTGNEIRGLECHPYDMAGWLVAKQAGVILTDGWGGELDLLLDVHSPVHWCGYANASLRNAIEPVIGQWLKEKGL